MKMAKLAISAALCFPILGGQTALAEDLVFTLTNATSGTLTYFHASPANVDDWEDDILGDQVVASGDSIEITIADGRDVCKYDMRFEFDEESELEITEDTQNLCELGSYTVEE